jgi:hypothetical protein
MKGDKIVCANALASSSIRLNNLGFAVLLVPLQLEDILPPQHPFGAGDRLQQESAQRGPKWMLWRGSSSWEAPIGLTADLEAVKTVAE